ncbi:hypothetical protein SYNPS1DRAFT_25375 [Syncephalis pseudoplumigaleata]|uniref:Very-long-chain 3-oxoacyl-CoA reductase n=1 Tax=Syncephalis pseudoplumigaleata TaxID=1712513 RepID=A0A4P9YS81_9FUNG|nr:hypothetical protein SYNPS1DRAFT_25375 [Syncephalis pseudoplumigaleata]|eukprot:RKP22756.1 hypothetical protein SYNPS1DRAFT_25375 [Syncephalis pseudoplumigaleata]
MTRPFVALSKFGAKKGVWAVITGCTDGIGKAYADQLAAAGFNVVLVSRTLSKLQDVQQEIEAKHKVETKVVSIDFAHATPDDYDRLRTAISDIPVGVLVNNVGTNHEFPVRFQDEDDKVIEAIVEVNVMAQLRVTKLVVPRMVERKNGLILNIGSMSAVSPTPLLSVYSGSKSFLRVWSQTLGEELASQGILVECVNAYFVVSSMSKVRRASYAIPSADTYVRSALKRIGLHGGSAVPFNNSPYLPHAIIDWLVERVLPRRLMLTYNHRT